ncbi:hypothetical protein [Sphingomonas sp. KR3-1]|uniref:hypothetical protein n=1 Tax=Sphingomonas sp. KR3-1 TaxID=3156611 RepID=UPI0032B596EF
MRKTIDYSMLKVTAATSAALLATSCGGGTLVANQPTRLCVDDAGQRIADTRCGSTGGGGAHGGGHAYYVGRGQRVPEMGEAATGGSTRPSAGVSYSSVSEGSVSRGGFGRSASVHGGFGGE